MKQKLSTLKNTIMMVLGLLAIIFVVSCEEAFEFDLPEAGSIADNTLPQANFSHTPNAENFRIIKFTNASSESTKYIWDFGANGVVCDTMTVNGVNGVVVCSEESTSTLKDVSFVRFAAGEGDYEVKLTALDANEASGVKIDTVAVRDVFVPINPIIENGDFDSSTSGWKIDSFTDGNTNAFNGSSDGSNTNYDGSDNGSKTKGAKWTGGTSNPLVPGSRRYAYQALTVSPTTADRTVKYVIEYEYAIKDTAAPGSKIIVEILDGHFDDGAVALTTTPLAQSVANELNGKGNFETVKKEFTSNASGQVAIWIYAETTQDSYVDNVKVYPKP